MAGSALAAAPGGLPTAIGRLDRASLRTLATVTWGQKGRFSAS